MRATHGNAVLDRATHTKYGRKPRPYDLNDGCKNQDTGAVMAYTGLLGGMAS